MSEHDLELERLVRASLDAHAAEADTAVPVAARARAAARTRRGTRIAAGLAVAAVAAVAVTAVAVDRADPPSEPAPPVATSPTPLPHAGWRTEYWHDLSIEVPEGWGWGVSPDRDGAFCGGPGAMRTPEGGDLAEADPTTPYVGRPIMLSDVCVSQDDSSGPRAPYVWLGSDVPLGTRHLGNGYTQETVEIGGTTVTVGTDDPAQRQQILASAAVGGPCASSLDAPPEVDVSGGDEPAASSLLVCAYRGAVAGSYDLVYADQLDAEAAAATEAAIESAPVLLGDCLNASGGDWAMLTARGDGWSREYAVDLNCPGVTDSLGRMHRLTPAMLHPWAVNGLPASIYVGRLG